jgi:hypothetical protein
VQPGDHVLDGAPHLGGQQRDHRLLDAGVAGHVVDPNLFLARRLAEVVSRRGYRQLVPERVGHP